MLVVISILGILAAVVTLSLVGVTNLAQKRANDEEMMTVQSAMNFMIMDQRIQPEAACGAPQPTNDMGHYPVNPPNPGDLTQRPPLGSPAQLYPHYLRKRLMNRAYTCTGGGAVQPG